MPTLCIDLGAMLTVSYSKAQHLPRGGVAEGDFEQYRRRAAGRRQAGARGAPGQALLRRDRPAGAQAPSEDEVLRTLLGSV